MAPSSPSYFLDTSYVLALLGSSDRHHATAVASAVCFCAVSRGAATEVCNISRMRKPDGLPELRALLEMIGFVAGQGPRLFGR